MIQLSIYFPEQTQAKAVIVELLKRQLVAHASIDYNNHVLRMENGELVEETLCLIRAETKALLFNDILDYIHERNLDPVRIFSTPITQCNPSFSELIRTKTISV